MHTTRCNLCGKMLLLGGEGPVPCPECGESYCPAHGPEDIDGSCLACRDPQLAAEISPEWAAMQAAERAEYMGFESKLNRALGEAHGWRPRSTETEVTLTQLVGGIERDVDVVALVYPGEQETPTSPASGPEVEVQSMTDIGTGEDIADLLTGEEHEELSQYILDDLAEKEKQMRGYSPY